MSFTVWGRDQDITEPRILPSLQYTIIYPLVVFDLSQPAAQKSSLIGQVNEPLAFAQS